MRAIGTAWAMALLIVVSLGGCAPMQDPAAASDTAHNSRNSLDWPGTYRGVLPCADCPGIETVVTLRADGSYVARTRYLGEDGASTVEEGRFTWSDDGGSISLSGDSPARYRVGENRLIRLALDGTANTGTLADHYVLAKMTGTITGKYWKLVELRGEPVPALDKEPHLILKAEGDRVTGFGGCNSFAGGYTLDEATARIGFEQLAMTRMFCSSGMNIERSFAEVLGQVDNYSVNGDRLTLNRARMAPLARFEAVYLP